MCIQFPSSPSLRNGGEQLLSLSEFDELRVAKQPNASMAAAGSTSANVELDQILDLNHVAETSSASNATAAAAAVNDNGPIIAFEDSITSPKPEPPVAGKISKPRLVNRSNYYASHADLFRFALLMATAR